MNFNSDIRSSLDNVTLRGKSEDVQGAQGSFLGRVVRQLSGEDSRLTGFGNLADVINDVALTLRTLGLTNISVELHAESLELLAPHKGGSGASMFDVAKDVNHLRKLVSSAIERFDTPHTERSMGSNKFQEGLDRLNHEVNRLAFLEEKLVIPEAEISTAQQRFMSADPVSKRDCDAVFQDALTWISDKSQELLKENKLPLLNDQISSLSSSLLRYGRASQGSDGSFSKEDLASVFSKMEAELNRLSSQSASMAGRSGVRDCVTPVLTDFSAYMDVMHLR